MIDHVPTHYNFAHDVVEHFEAEKPGATALWWADEAGNDKRFSFADMGKSLRRAANFFAAQGIGKGDRVLVILPRIPQWWVAMLGLIRLGAVPIPGTPLLTRKDIAYRLDIASVKAVITDSGGAEKIDAFHGPHIIAGDSRPGWTSFDKGIAAACDQREYEPTRGNDPGIIYFTSGTVGEAKMVLHTQVSYGLGHVITGKG